MVSEEGMVMGRKVRGVISSCMLGSWESKGGEKRCMVIEGCRWSCMVV